MSQKVFSFFLFVLVIFFSSNANAACLAEEIVIGNLFNVKIENNKLIVDMEIADGETDLQFDSNSPIYAKAEYLKEILTHDEKWVAFMYGEHDVCCDVHKISFDDGAVVSYTKRNDRFIIKFQHAASSEIYYNLYISPENMLYYRADKILEKLIDLDLSKEKLHTVYTDKNELLEYRTEQR